MFPIALPNGLTIVGAKDAKFTCPKKGHLECTIIVTGGAFGDVETPLPFSAKPDDVVPHGVAIYEHFKKLKSTAKYVKPGPNIIELKDEFDELMIDVSLGLASDEEVARAKELRVMIKELSAV